MQAKLRYFLPLAVAAGLGIGTYTNLVAQSPGVNSPFNPVWSIPLDSIKRSYMNAMQLSPGGFATDIYQICGAPSKTTKITRIVVSARATVVSPMDIFLVKRSNWDTGGTVANGVSSLGIQIDSTEAPGGAAVTGYTNSSNGGTTTTLGTLVGVIGVIQGYMGNLTTGTSPGPVVFDFSARSDRSPTLNTNTDCVAINLSGTSQGANQFDIFSEWTEEP